MVFLWLAEGAGAVMLSNCEVRRGLGVGDLIEWCDQLDGHSPADDRSVEELRASCVCASLRYPVETLRDVNVH